MNQFINGYDEKWNQAQLDSEQKNIRVLTISLKKNCSSFLFFIMKKEYNKSIVFFSPRP